MPSWHLLGGLVGWTSQKRSFMILRGVRGFAPVTFLLSGVEPRYGRYFNKFSWVVGSELTSCDEFAPSSRWQKNYKGASLFCYKGENRSQIMAQDMSRMWFGEHIMGNKTFQDIVFIKDVCEYEVRLWVHSVRLLLEWGVPLVLDIPLRYDIWEENGPYFNHFTFELCTSEYKRCCDAQLISNYIHRKNEIQIYFWRVAENGHPNELVCDAPWSLDGSA